MKSEFADYWLPAEITSQPAQIPVPLKNAC